MKCQRCQGLTVRDEIFDPDGPYLHIAVLRCLNCGETVYVDNQKSSTKEDHSKQNEKNKSKAA